MRLRHTLVQEGSAVAANQELQSVAQQSVSLEGYQRILLPADPDIFAAAVLAPLDRKLIHHSRSSVSVFCKHTIPEEQMNSQ